jgi:hypothetical protein
MSIGRDGVARGVRGQRHATGTSWRSEPCRRTSCSSSAEPTVIVWIRLSRPSNTSFPSSSASSGSPSIRLSTLPLLVGAGRHGHDVRGPDSAFVSGGELRPRETRARPPVAAQLHRSGLKGLTDHICSTVLTWISRLVAEPRVAGDPRQLPAAAVPLRNWLRGVPPAVRDPAQ